MLITPRLELLPLDGRRIGLWTRNLPALEKELRCRYDAEPLTGIFLSIVQEQERAVLADPENVPWHSFWLLIRRSDRVVVGSADFKNVPNEAGEAEIGYGLGEHYCHQGYMTEAVQAMCGWAFEQPGVRRLVAETEREGFASQRLLRRCGFEQYRIGVTLWWKREAPSCQNENFSL